MFPFSALLESNRAVLKLSAINVTKSSSASIVCVGFRFRGDGRFQTFTAEGSSAPGDAVYITISEEWVNEAFWDIVDGALYECLITGLSGSGAADLRFPVSLGPPPPNVDEWFGLGATKRAQLCISAPGTLAVTGTMKVRKIASPSNVKVASFSLSVTKT